jgi:hypothetical protein
MTTVEASVEMEKVGEESRDHVEPDDTASMPPYAKSPYDVLKCKFVVLQVVFNLLASFLGPLGTFFLLFGYLSEGPYAWSSGPLVGVVVGSLAGCPILIFALMPVGMPEAVERGWLPRLRLEDCPPWMLRWLPFLNDHPRWRWATVRNLALSLMVGVVYVPIALLIARYALGPNLETWTLIWFNVAYEVLLALPIVALGLLGSAMEHNLDRTIEQMSMHPNVVLRYLYRSLTSLKMTVCP